MIKGLILYYLNIKPTHGYEIQKFIQISGMDQWTKIQSGSIYYALTKLEKEKHIQVLKEERTGSRVRKIYEITELGRKELEKEMRMQIMTPIMETGSLKYIVYPMISVLSMEETIQLVEKHIYDLEEKKKYWEYWSGLKTGMSTNRLTKLSFDMTIHALEDQIVWHQELLQSMGDYRTEAEDMTRMIKAFEPDSIPDSNKDISYGEDLKQKLTQMEQIKESIESDPKLALEQLNQMMESIKKQMK